jgi:ribosomal protein S18 acetylase RimI-like enzyme
MLQDFNRFQHVEQDWYPDENGGYYLVYQPHNEDWSEIRKREIANELCSALGNGGKLFGAYDTEKLIGFCCIDGILLGSEKQYLELTWFHVSYEYRGKKIGKKLFGMCAEAARNYSCKKLYIVASSSEESQKVYHKLGCVYAKELIPRLYEDRPNDVHMEFML